MRFAFATVLSLCFAFAPPAVGAERKPQPRLVLQITVDQLRGDLPARYYDRFGEGGFRYLFEHGTVFRDAHHGHATTETIVGHATLATGAHPSAHGLIGNVWFDRKTGALTYNIEDPRYKLLTAGAEVDKQAEIDPTQKAASTGGRSPRSMLASTFSDELTIFTGGRAKVFGVSVKDRGAVSMAGHAGKAYWFSKASGEFVTSSYYYDEYPSWVTQWNQGRPAHRYSGQTWKLRNDRSSYLFGDADDQPWETDFPGYSRAFPHSFGQVDDKYFTTRLTLSPVGDELTLEFAKALIENENLGQDSIPDYLAVSFSSTDYVGHIFGPSSLESEDNLLCLDRTLAALLAYVDEKVGLENTLIVLSADHGSPEVPGYLNSLGVDAGYIRPEEWETQPAIEAMKKKFGLGSELIQAYHHPYVYLGRNLIEEQELDQRVVERAVAAELESFPGIALAVSSSALRDAAVPDTPLLRSVLNNFHPERSGDIFVVFEPHWFLNDFDGLSVAATHGSPWRYDTYVPLVFCGAGVPAQNVNRRVYTVDLAPTLASFLGTKPPSSSAGSVLQEVLDGR